MIHYSHCYGCCDALCGLLNVDVKKLTETQSKVTCKNCRKLIRSKSFYIAQGKDRYPRSGGSVEGTTAFNSHRAVLVDKAEKVIEAFDQWCSGINGLRGVVREIEELREYLKGDLR